MRPAPIDSSTFETGNEGKSNFDQIYNQPDPRSYFHTLEPLNYIIPGQAKPIFRTLIETFQEKREQNEVQILDVGCSYGINGALLKYDLSLNDLYEHYCSPEVDRLNRSRLLSRDSHLLENQPENDALKVVGLDSSPEAVHYALEAGYIDDGIVANLEGTHPDPEASHTLADTDLIISTGCVGYVTETTFSHIFDSLNDASSLWVASFVLRMFPYEPIAQVLKDQGLATEKLTEPLFIQRRFESEEEKNHVLQQLESLQIDPSGRESEGCYYANLFLSRPEEEIHQAPLQQILEEKLGMETTATIL